jgi:trimeric autotransporter adhesin
MKPITLNQLTVRIKRSTLFIIAVLVQACTGSDPSPVSSTGNIDTIAGIAGDFDFKGDGGPAVAANLGYVTDITVDASGNIYFADGAANVVRKIDRSTGNISTIAGTFLGFNVVDPTPFQGDGGPATSAHLNVPFGVAVDASGNVYIADSGNNVVRKISSSTGIISTIAGKVNSLGYTGDGGPATNAELFNPYDVAVDPIGNVYIADSQNHTVRKISATTGIITTIAGTGPINSGYAGDGGPAISAKLNAPQGVAIDAAGDVYIADAGNHAIRKITASTGIISTISGSGTYGYSGDGGLATAAKLYAPSKVAIDDVGDVYIADQGSHVIRKVTVPTGIISTLAGSGAAGFSGDGGPATAARLSSPQGVAVDLSGNVFVTDGGNGVIRAVKQ